MALFHVATVTPTKAGDVPVEVVGAYRDEPLAGAEDALIVEMQHSVLGTRWVYDGVRDRSSW